MIRYGCLILSVAGILSAGCRADPATELLERELRWQEDEIYHLEDVVDQLKSQLHAYEHGTFSSVDDNDDDRDRRLPSSSERVGPPSVDIGEPVEELPQNLEQAPPFEGLPQYDPLPPAGEESYHYEPAALSGDGPDTAQARETSGFFDPGEVDEITLNALLTGLRDFDGEEGYDGVALSLEPRNADGEIVESAGAISVVVLDEAQPGASARIARWDLTADEARAHFRKSSVGNGIHLELTWPEAAPVTDQLQMFVRFTSAEGQVLETEHRLGPGADAALPSTGWQAARRPRRRAARRPAEMPHLATRPPRSRPTPRQTAEESGPTIDLPAAREQRTPTTRPREQGLPRGPQPPVWTPYR